MLDLGKRPPASPVSSFLLGKGVEASFRLSYDALDSQAQRLFRLLGTPDLHDFTAWSVAAMLGVPQVDAKRLLDGLMEMSLLTGVVDACGIKRYKLFDLLSIYAWRRLEHDTPEADRRQALDRLARAYYGCVNYAFNLRNTDNPMVDSQYLPGWRAEYPDAKAAVEGARDSKHKVHPEWWFAVERENLLALVKLASQMNPPLPITPKLASSLFYFLEMGGYWEEWRTADTAGLTVAENMDDNCAHARSLRNLGRLEMVLVEEQQESLRDDAQDPYSAETAAGDCGHAVSLLQKSRDLYRECDGGTGGEATALRELADADRLQGRVPEALEAYKAAEEVFGMLPKNMAANAVASLQLGLGRTYKLRGEPGDFFKAGRCFHRSLKYASQQDADGKLRHPRLKGYALRRLADLYRDQEKLQRAVEYYDQSVAVFQDSGDMKSAARALAERGRVLIRLPDRLEMARSSLSEAKAIFEGRGAAAEAEVVNRWLAELAVPG